MAKKQNKSTKTCADCIHENACRAWVDGRYIADESANRCPNYETVKESGAYLCGVLDERKRKKTNADRIRSMTNEELATFINRIVICHQLRKEGNCVKCPIHPAKPCDTEGIVKWLQQPCGGYRRGA